MFWLPFLKIIHYRGIFFDNLTKHSDITIHLIKLQILPVRFLDLPDKPATKSV